MIREQWRAMMAWRKSLAIVSRWPTLEFLLILMGYIWLLLGAGPAATLAPSVSLAISLQLVAPRRRTVVLVLVGVAVCLLWQWWRPTGAWSQLLAGLSAQLLVLGACGISLFSPRGSLRTKRRLKSRLHRQRGEMVSIQARQQQFLNNVEMDRQALLEYLPVYVVQKDRHGRFTFVTDSFCQLLGRPRHEVLGKRDQDLFPPKSAEKFARDDQWVMGQRAVFDDVERTELPGGDVVFMHVRKAPLLDPDGQVAGVLVVFWDVTKEHLSQQELRRIESLTRAIINAALDCVLLVDDEGSVLEVNPASERILGYRRDQLVGQPPLDSILRTALHEVGQRTDVPDDGSRVYERKSSIRRIMAAATGTRIEAKVCRRDGQWFDAEISSHPLAIDGQTQGWALFIRDITQRKRHELELRRAKEAAEQANVAKGEFVANVSHELRTPLTGILGLLELLQRSDVSPRQQNYLQLAQMSSNNLLHLIDDLLDFSKIEAGRLEIEEAPFDVRHCVEEAADSLAARAQLKGLELTVDCPRDLPTTAIGDAHRLRQLLLNLVGNAIKFTERGDICIRVHCLAPRDGLDRPLFRIEVHDSGIGVAEAQRETIFDAFRQADYSMTRRFGGTGLGLTICRDLVRKMNGLIGVSDSQLVTGVVNPGSCFYVELPLAVQPARPGQAENPTDSAWSRQDVVLVAGQTLWRQVLNSRLEELGLKVIQLSTDQLRQRQPAKLFSAGNNTIVMMDARELAGLETMTPPVVVRWILITPLAQGQPAALPKWLSHADVVWLTRPIRQTELLNSLSLQASTVRRSDQAERAEHHGKSAQVLLVEDSLVSQTVLRDMLESLGHQVTMAADGRAAVELCRQRRYDLVLMDIQMPDMDGLQATREIRRQEAPGHRQLIYALTAHASIEDRQHCESAGMDGFLEKPITIDLLSSAVASALHNGVTPPAQSRFVSTAELKQSAEQPSGDLTFEIPTPQSVHDQGPSWEVLLRKMNDNQPLLRDVLALVGRETPRLSRGFVNAVGNRNLLEARRCIHTFKSNARQIGLERVADFAQRLETLAREERAEEIALYCQPVEQLGEAIADWVEQLLQARPA